jgi:hypothetical protein
MFLKERKKEKENWWCIKWMECDLLNYRGLKVSLIIEVVKEGGRWNADKLRG